MAVSYTAVIQQHGEWWIGWLEEIPGVNSRAEARAAASGAYEEVSIVA